MIGICSYGAYVPLYRLAREIMVLEGKGGAGERAVAGADEDALTMAVDAILDCTRGMDRGSIDALLSATTSSPFAEKQLAAAAAAALDFNDNIITADLTASLKAGLTAVKLAADMVKAGSAKKALVAATDCRLGTPLSALESNSGDGAAALLVGDKDAIATIEGFYTFSTDFTDTWRPATDKFVHVWSDRFTVAEGYSPMMQKAIAAAMKKFGVEAKDISKLVYSGPDARNHGAIAGALKFDPKAQLQDGLFGVMGNTGAAHPLMLLVAALEQAKAGDTILVAGWGDGVDVMLLKVTDAIEKARDRHGVLGYLKSKKMLPSYVKYLRLRHLFYVEASRMTPITPGLAQLWRERDSMYKLHASKCKQCGWLEFPIRRICPKCYSKDNYEQVKLLDQKVKVYSFSTDTIPTIPEVTDPPLGRAIVDFEGGARLELEMTDFGNIQDMKVGQPMEMTFRRLERQGDVAAYAWKTKPVR
jgi:3-hydroxy-3-methylglutaryl CoA synthase